MGSSEGGGCKYHGTFRIFPRRPPTPSFLWEILTSYVNEIRESTMILFKIFPEDRPPPPFSKKFLSFTENFLISYDFSDKKVPCTFRKFQKTPTHPLGTFRDMWSIKKVPAPPAAHPIWCSDLRIYEGFNSHHHYELIITLLIFCETMLFLHSQ